MCNGTWERRKCHYWKLCEIFTNLELCNTSSDYEGLDYVLGQNIIVY